METYRSNDRIELYVQERERERVHERQTLWRNRGWNASRNVSTAFQSNRNNVTLVLSLSLSSWLINRPCQTLRNHANGCSFVISCFMERDYVARRVRTRRFRLDRRYLASLFFFYPQRERNEIISSIYFFLIFVKGIENRRIEIWQLRFRNFLHNSDSFANGRTLKNILPYF